MLVLKGRKNKRESMLWRLCGFALPPEHIKIMKYTLILVALLMASVASATVISGCTDNKALNYDKNATVDDGSCKYASNGNPLSAVMGWGLTGFETAKKVKVLRPGEGICPVWFPVNCWDISSLL